MLNYVFDQSLDFVLRDDFMDAFSKRSKHKMHIFLLGLEVLNERAVERQKDQIVAPDNSGYQGHVDQLMSVFLVLATHDVEELFCESLRVVDDVDWHEVLCSRVDLALPQPPRCFLLLFLELFLLVLGLTHDSLLRTQVSWINSLILTIRQLFKRHGSLHQEMAGHHAASTRRRKAGLSDDVDRTVISPHIPLIEFYQQFQRLLGSLIGMLGDICRDKGADLLVDLVVLVVAVHTSDIVEQVLVDHRAELLVLQPHLFQQEGNGGHGQQNVLGPKDHHASRALLPQIGVQAGPQFLHQSHGCTRNPAQNLREKLDRPGKEDKKFAKALILLHGISLHLLKLDLEEAEIVLHIPFVENRITRHLDGEILQFLEHGIVDGLLVDFLH